MADSKPAMPSAEADSAADRAFARFGAGGDPADLAEVFDHTARRLILVAMHLVRDRADAEDLLQTTFVEAIRSAGSFERGRRVLPWLLAILGRQAHRHHRRRVRERAERLLPASVASPDAGPGERAAGREAMDQVVAALEELDPPFREVLVLRLVHGLRPVEIARALGRPAGTVHAQLHRGLERLRRALPRALALPAILLLGAGHGLAAVRRRVLAAVPTGAAGATAAGGAGAKALTVLGAAMLAATLLWLVGRVVSPAPGPRPDSSRRAGTLAADTPGAVRSAAAPAQPPSAARTPVARTAPAGEPCTIVGRVVAAENGAPLAGVSVRLEGYAARQLGHGLPVGWQQPEPQRTSGDGAFSFAFEPDPRVGLTMHLDAPGRVPVAGSWLDLRPGARVAVGDLPLQPGTPTVIHVVGDAGRPAAEVGVVIESPPRRDQGLPAGFATQGTGTIHYTDAAGALPAVMLQARTWDVGVAAETGFRLVTPSRFTIAPGEPGKIVELQVARPDPTTAISGCMVDEQGAPVARMEVRAVRESGWQLARTDSSGRFFLPAVAPRGTECTLDLRPGALGLVLLEPREPVAVGASGVRVVVRRQREATVHLAVVDADTRLPLDVYRCVLVPCRKGRRTRLAGSLAMPRFESHRSGRVELSTWPGDHLLFVQARDPRHAPVLARPLQVPEGAGDLEVEVAVEPSVPWTVRVVDETGRAVAGAHVELLRDVVHDELAARAPGQPLSAVFDGRGRGATDVLVTATGDSDAQGVARLSSASDLGVAALRARGQSIAPALRRLAERPAHLPFEVVVRRAGVIDGRVTPPAFVSGWGPGERDRQRYANLTTAERKLDFYRVKVTASCRDHAERRRVCAVVADDGRFRLPSLMPGTWSLVLDVTTYDGHRVARRHALCPTVVAGLRGGETRAVEIDARELVPGRVRGRLLAGAAPWPGGELVLETENGRLAFEPASDGSFATGPMIPGDYTAFLSRGGDPEPQRVRLGVVHVAAGRTTAWQGAVEPAASGVGAVTDRE